MVKLVLHLEFRDIGHKDIMLQMDAPQLPAGVAWYDGMYFMPHKDSDGVGYEVKAIWAFGDGTCEVHFFVEQSCDFSEVVIAEFAADGWVEYDGWELPDSSR